MPPGDLGVVGRPSRRAKSGQDAITEDREWSGGLPEGLKVVGSGREAITKGWERSEDHHGGSGVVGRQYRRARSSRRPLLRVGSGWEAILEGREWSGGHHRESGVVRRPFVRVRSGPEAIPEGREWSGGHHGELGGLPEWS